MRNLLTVILLFSLLACVERKEKIRDIKDIQAQSKSKTKQKSIVEDSVDYGLRKYINFKDAGLDYLRMELNDKKLFPDRFNSTSSERFSFEIKDQKSDFYQWNFRDSSLVMNAFFNWLDYFEVSSFGAEQSFQEDPFLIFITDTSLIFIDNKQLKLEQWAEILEKLGFRKLFNFAVEQAKKGRARWYEFKKDRFVRMNYENS